MRTRPPTPTARSAACAALAVVYLAASLGLPVPAASGGSHPCEHRACGCSAERILSGSCCCFTPAVKSCCSTKTQGQRPKWVLAWEAARCHGQGPGGLIVPPPGLPPVPSAAVARWLEPGAAVAAVVRLPVCVPSRPPTPPPKLV